MIAMTDMLVESRIRGNMYVRFGGEYKETSHRNMKRRHILSLLNHLPNQHNAYGFDIDSKAVAVARYLYPLGTFSVASFISVVFLLTI